MERMEALWDLWRRYGSVREPMEALQKRYGTAMGPVWDRYGSGMEAVWNRYGSGMEPLGKLWNGYGSYGTVREPMEVVWNR